MRPRAPHLLLIACVFAVVACERPVPPPRVDPAALARGAALYREHCSACHGSQAQGAPNWHQPLADGRMPPPPLDGSGHAWHHPRAWLRATIRDGLGPARGMPGFRDRLTDADVEAVIDWFQSLWPAEIYRAWRESDAASHAGAR